MGSSHTAQIVAVDGIVPDSCNSRSTVNVIRHVEARDGAILVDDTGMGVNDDGVICTSRPSLTGVVTVERGAIRGGTNNILFSASTTAGLTG